ncbi:MAG: spore coat associated protein CotJA [Clostridia bacterium]|nr:spore coat associated protein CotJA [Clostridia bacterium]
MIPALPKNPVVAMAYVPFQTDTATYDEVKALACGTLFPCLNKPFRGSGTR